MTRTRRCPARRSIASPMRSSSRRRRKGCRWNRSRSMICGRTGSTLLNEIGFNSDWIEKCLAHEDGRSSRGVYNKAEYEAATSAHDAGVVRHHRRLGRRQEVVAGRSFRLRCRCSSRTRRSNRPRPPQSDVGRLSAGDRSRPARGQPSFDLRQIPDHAARRESEASGKFSALLHLIDRAVGERHHLSKLLSANCFLRRDLSFPRHFKLHRTFNVSMEIDRWRYWKALWQRVALERGRG